MTHLNNYRQTRSKGEEELVAKMSEQTITLDELAEQTQNLRESSKSDAKRREGQ